MHYHLLDIFAMRHKHCRKRWEYRWAFLCYAFLLFFGRGASGQIRYSIQEELKIGSFVGNIAQDLGLDIEKLRDRGFRVVSGSKEQLFQVNQKDGSLFVNENIDREKLCQKNSKCIINLKAVVENPLEMHHIEVGILDVNDHSPNFPEREKRLEIAESTIPGARFQLQGAFDPDVGINSLRSYKMNQNEHFQLEVKDRGEDKKIPVLVLQKPLDREKKPNHILLLTAFDGGTPERSGVLNITVVVLDINDNAPVFDREVYSVTLKENVPVGTLLIKVNASDLDEGPNGEVVYSFGNSIRSKEYEAFDLNMETGEIKVKGEIDFEEHQSYEIDIQASDKGQSPLIAQCSVLVKIEDANDNRPEIDITSLSNVIPEDAHPGTVVALMGVVDSDSGKNGEVVCTLQDNLPFVLKPSSREKFYSLVTNRKLDREVTPMYNVTITASDLGNPSLSSFKTITVMISDVNDNRPEFSQNPYALYLVENNVPGASIFSVSASDADQNENALVSYMLGNDFVDMKVASFLNINSENGNIYALKSFDFEEIKFFKFLVTAVDSGVPPLSSNVTVNVFILDQNDNAPAILSPLIYNGSVELQIPRNANSGYLVTKMRVYDADIGYNAWLSFSLLQVTDPSLFSLERHTGEIRTLRPFTESDDSEHKLIMQVKDNGNISLFTTATILITTVEDTEAFAISDFKNTEKNVQESNLTFYLVIALGSVSVLFVFSIITLAIMHCSSAKCFSPDNSSNTNYADVSGNGTLCHSIQYRAGEKRYMLVGPRMSIGSTIGPGSKRNTLVIQESGGDTSGEVN